MRVERVYLRTLVGLACVLSGACGRFSRPSEATSDHPLAAEAAAVGSVRKSPSAAGQQALARSYPPGLWRHIAMENLQSVVLWFSHILIRHNDVPAGVVSFDLAEWMAAPEPPVRPRRDAFDIAQRLSREATLHPERFADLARANSEDIATRDNGGSFGGVIAIQLQSWDGVLDTLSALGRGDVSDVVETEYGFHIFQRHSPPVFEQVSGSRIIIAYDEAPWLHFALARGPLPRRSRAEALARAEEAYQAAQKDPDGFERLVDEFSDHQDAMRGGDLGSWSTQEPTPFPREIEVLRRLNVGEVARPMDSKFGVQIIRRVPYRMRSEYAITSIEKRFDPSAPTHEPLSRVSTQKGLQAIYESLRGAPARFAEFQREYCCEVVEQWPEGRGWAPVEQAISELGLGEISMQPVTLGPSQLAIVKRLRPTPARPPEIRFDLPTSSEGQGASVVVEPRD